MRVTHTLLHLLTAGALAGPLVRAEGGAYDGWELGYQPSHSAA